MADLTMSRRALLRRGAGAAAGLALVGGVAARVRGAGAEPQVRRNVTALSADERIDFANAVMALKSRPSPWVSGISTYDTFVLWHRDAMGCGVNAAHMGPAFFPWHRRFLRLFEETLQTIEPAVTLPYWDWTVDRSTTGAPWFDDLLGGNGDPAEGEAVMTGPFRKGSWEISIFDPGDMDQVPYLARNFGASKMAAELPTAEEVEEALAIATYDASPWNATVPPGSSFRNAFEGWQDCAVQGCDPVGGISPICGSRHNIHNRVHLWVAGESSFMAHVMTDAGDGTRTDDVMGTMAASSSPNDPVFWLHHANVDRLWAVWQERHGLVYQPETGGPFGHNIDDPMWPYEQIGMTVTPRMVLDHRAMGYRYDTESA